MNDIEARLHLERWNEYVMNCVFMALTFAFLMIIRSRNRGI